jgi:hypothetical protein
MWYYIKDSKPKGPVADSAIMSMFKSGEIDKETLVRSGHGKAWKRFKTTRFFSRMLRRRSLHIDDLVLRTKLLRAFLTSLFILVAITMLLPIGRWAEMNVILAAPEAFSEISLRIIRADYTSVLKLSNAITFVVLLVTVYLLMRWVKTVTFNARMLDKQFAFSPSFSAWSVVFPLINFIHPFVVISTIYKSAKGVVGARFTIVDFSLIFLWWFFTIFSLVVLVFDRWFLTFAPSLDRAKAVLIFNMYSVSVFMFAIALWILLVSRINKLQQTAFNMDV